MEDHIHVPDNFPADATVKLPTNSDLPESEKHFLLFIPWEDKYLQFVPADFRQFFSEVFPLLSARTTDVHTAVCLQYLDEFVKKSESTGQTVNRKVLALSLILHDSGWSQMSQKEIAASLGATGLALNDTAMGPKEKHAVLGEKIAQQILEQKKEELDLSGQEIIIICQAIRYHDMPEQVAGMGNQIPIEMQLHVDLDHIWSFTHLNFWQDTLRKGIEPKLYLENLRNDLENYFVTNIGKSKAKELLSFREKEVLK